MQKRNFKGNLFCSVHVRDCIVVVLLRWRYEREAKNALSTHVKTYNGNLIYFYFFYLNKMVQFNFMLHTTHFVTSDGLNLARKVHDQLYQTTKIMII